MLNTAQKIALARMVYHIIMVGRRIIMRGGSPPVVEVVRGGVRWRLDLGEGIDFSIYLLGGFELSTLRLYRKLVKSGDVVLDIGANIGAHTLPLARLVGESGRVIAFEPTAFAINKLHENIARNPDLIPRIVTHQAMLVADSSDNLEPAIFSSWPLVAADALHEKHKGRLMDTSGARAVTLDEVIDMAGIQRLNFIKLDVDGHEYAVLSGGKKTLKHYRPSILMELAPYLFSDKPSDFEGMLEIFRELDYTFNDAATGEPLPLDAGKLEHSIPDGASRNIIARPSSPNIS